MSKLIRKKIYEIVGTDNFDVSRSKNHGDFSTNVLMKNKNIDKDFLLKELEKEYLIKNIEYKNGFINIFLNINKIDFKEFIYTENCSINGYYLKRVKNIIKILSYEKYSDIDKHNEFLNNDYINLLKSYNYLIESGLCNCISDEDIQRVIENFRILDSRNVYRKFKKFELYKILILLIDIDKVMDILKKG